MAVAAFGFEVFAVEPLQGRFGSFHRKLEPFAFEIVLPELQSFELFEVAPVLEPVELAAAVVAESDAWPH